MKKKFAGTFFVLLLIWSLCGCTAGGKTTDLSSLYGVAAVLSLALLVSCYFMVPQKRSWLILLFSCVFIVNTGYTLLAVSTNLQMALWANRLSYLGSVFLPLSMLMIILEVTGTPFKKRLPLFLLGSAFIVFLIAASPGILDIYYKDVSFEIINGTSRLVKVYGPLHPLYLVYLVGYFLSMVVVILRAQRRKLIDSTAHAVILAIAVFVNIGVWLIEQIVSIDFEMLSVSYIISELFLLGIHLVMRENQKLRDIVNQVKSVQEYPVPETASSNTMIESPLSDGEIAPERITLYMTGLEQLTPTEKVIFEAYLARETTKEVMASLNITENTLKYHNKHIYSKLGVSSRKELLEFHKQLNAVKAKLEDTLDKV